jgi:transcription elongation factor Elf1
VGTSRAVGRTRPYTEAGIRRVPCVRCGARASAQWSVCALDNRYVAVCDECDVGLNAAALDYMNVPGADRIVAAYARAKGLGPALVSTLTRLK